MLPCMFLAALWKPARKGLTSWISDVLCFATFPYVTRPNSDQRLRLVPLNVLKPSVNLFTGRFKAVLLLWILVLLLSFFYTVLSVPSSHLINCWERADFFSLLCVMFSCVLSLSHMVSMRGSREFVGGGPTLSTFFS